MALTFSFGICRLADPTSTQNRLQAFAAELSAIGKAACKPKTGRHTSKTATNPGFQAFMMGWTGD